MRNQAVATNVTRITRNVEPNWRKKENKREEAPIAKKKTGETPDLFLSAVEAEKGFAERRTREDNTGGP